MTIAERIRTEKRSQVNFDAVAFMQMVEEWFTSHDYDTWLTIKSDDCYRKYPSLCVGTLYKNFSKKYPTISYIGVPPEYLKDALKLLRSEGFYLYRDTESEYKVKIDNVPFISYGYNTWFNETDKF